MAGSCESLCRNNVPQSVLNTFCETLTPLSSTENYYLTEIRTNPKECAVFYLLLFRAAGSHTL